MHEITIHITRDLDPGKYMWYEENTYGPSMSLRSYGFKSVEDAFEDAKITVAAHYSSPQDLLFIKEIHHGS